MVPCSPVPTTQVPHQGGPAPSAGKSLSLPEPSQSWDPAVSPAVPTLHAQPPRAVLRTSPGRSPTSQPKRSGLAGRGAVWRQVWLQMEVGGPGRCATGPSAEPGPPLAPGGSSWPRGWAGVLESDTWVRFTRRLCDLGLVPVFSVLPVLISARVTAPCCPGGGGGEGTVVKASAQGLVPRDGWPLPRPPLTALARVQPPASPLESHGARSLSSPRHSLPHSFWGRREGPELQARWRHSGSSSQAE